MRLYKYIQLAVAAAVCLISPPVLAVVDLLEGYGYSSYEPMCAYVCKSAVPYTLDCPEYANMTAEERAEAYPSPACFAGDASYLTSVAWCIKARCDDTTKASSIQEFWETSLIYEQDQPGVVLKYATYIDALYHINTTVLPTPMSVNETVLNRTISVTDDRYLGYLNAAKSYEETGVTGSRGMFLVLFSGIVVPIGMTIISVLPWPAKLTSLFHAYFIDPPVFGRYHSVPVLNLAMIPTRGQAIFILYIIFVNVLANSLGFLVLTPNSFFPDTVYMLTRYIANRAGDLAFANLPLLILYGGRNSPLLWVTNWSHATYLLAHRWIATICVLQTCLHSAMWLQIMVSTDSHAEAAKMPYWYWGIVGTLSMTLLIPFSVLPIRKKWYEIFLIGHIALAILAIVGSYYHIVYLYEHGSGFDLFLYASMGIWGMDRLLRVARTASNGIKRAYVSRVDDEYIRVDVPGVDSHGYCYAYFPTISWRPWENHPFSVIGFNPGNQHGQTISTSESQSDSDCSPSSPHPSIKAEKKEAGFSRAKPCHIATPNAQRGGISMFIRVHSGMTKLLASKAGAAAGIPVLIEGSYGHEGKTMLQGHDHKFTPTLDYPNTLCIAGGAGIAAVLPVLNQTYTIYGMRGTTKLYWGLRSRELVDAVESNIVGPDGERANWGQIEPHITVGSRLNVRQILEDELGESSVGTTVIVCGPLAMCDEVRYTVAALARHGKVIRFVEESLPW